MKVLALWWAQHALNEPSIFSDLPRKRHWLEVRVISCPETDEKDTSSDGVRKDMENGEQANGHEWKKMQGAKRDFVPA